MRKYIERHDSIHGHRIKTKPNAPWPRATEILTHRKFVKLQYSHFRLVRTRLTRNFGLQAQKPLVQNQIALTHILHGLG